jgi:opacity protein-like surface antigen
LSLGLAALLISTPAMADGNINLALGQRSLDEGDYAPVDEQPFFGVTADFKKDWPVDLAGGLYFSSKSDSIGDVEVSASLIEATFGVMKTWNLGSNMHPFLGGGAGLVRAKAEIEDEFFGSSVSEDDIAPAFYTEGGVYWTLNNSFNLGLTGRFMTAPGMELAGDSFDTTYFQVGVLAGWAWSSR